MPRQRVRRKMTIYKPIRCRDIVPSGRLSSFASTRALAANQLTVALYRCGGRRNLYTCEPVGACELAACDPAASRQTARSVDWAGVRTVGDEESAAWQPRPRPSLRSWRGEATNRHCVV